MIHYQVSLIGYDPSTTQLVSGPERFVVTGAVAEAIKAICAAKSWPHALLLSIMHVEWAE